MDEGRKADMRYIETQLKRRDLDKSKRQELEHSRAMIKRQASNPEIVKWRTQMNEATKQQDMKALEQARGQLTRIDKLEHYDQTGRIRG